MVLQEPINPPYSREFVLRKTSVRDLKTLEDRVKQLFEAEFEVFIPCKSVAESTSQDEQSDLDNYDPSIEWIRLMSEEHPELLDGAKEYIISVCNPEVRCRVDFPVCDLLEEKGSLNIVDEVERKTCAYLAVDSEGFLEICGSTMAVALATSSLDQMKTFIHSSDSVTKDYNQNQLKSEDCKEVKEVKTEDVETEVVWKRRDTTRIVKLPPKSNDAKECSNTSSDLQVKDSRSNEDLSAGEEKILKTLKEEANTNSTENLDDRTVQTSLSSADETTTCCEAVEHATPNTMISGESLRDFALKLRYSESAVSNALSKLGPEADKNLLLLELVNAQNSAKQIEEGPSISERPQPCSSLHLLINNDPSTLRAIVIDGSNVAMSHGNQKVFSCRGIGLAVDWFLKRGHRDIKVFVPSWRKESSKPESPIIDQEVLIRLDEDNILVWTPSRCINNRRVVCYDDRFIIRLAHQTDGVIVSNDNFRDLANESPEWKKVIEQRLLMYSFVDDRFMPPDDPAGRHGPTLDEFLHKGCGKPCPYGRRCTYGNRCKFLHPERNSKTEAEMSVLANQLSEKVLIDPPEIPYGEVQKDGLGAYRDSCTPRQSRPLPPPPDMPAYLLTKPLPPPPIEPRQAKPLPIPQAEMYHNMVRIFPPTLRNNHASPSGQRPASDPSPLRTPFYEIPDHYGSTLTRRGSIPHMMSAGHYVDGYPSLPSGSGHYSHPLYPTHAPLPHPQDVVARTIVPDDMYACGYQQPFQSYQPQHWAVSQSYQPPPHSQYPHGPQYLISSNGHPHYQPHYSNGYSGQGNSYYRTRAPPRDVTDGPRTEDCEEDTRIKIYETLVEVFPDNATKILKVLDENPDVIDIDELTQILLDTVEKDTK